MFRRKSDTYVILHFISPLRVNTHLFEIAYHLALAKYNIGHTLNSQKTPHIQPIRVSYGVSVVFAKTMIT